MRRYLSLYGYFLTLRIKTLLSYRLDFVIGAVASAVMQTSTFLALFFILRQTGTMEGWTLPELQLLYGSLILSLALNQMFADNLWSMTHLVRSGKFDTFLTRPVHPLFHLLAERFNHVGIGDFVCGSILVALAAPSLPFVFAGWRMLYWMLSVLAGGGIFFSLNLLCSVSAFWLLDSVTITRVVFDNHQFAKYPLTIFPYLLYGLLTFLLPYGLAAFHPIAWLLGKPGALPALLPLVCALALTSVSIVLWCRALPRYTSAGS
ncbi:MAG TPA: ABC-2 family transporter protein [Herpetosiphonaceae bacterium]